MSYYRSLIQYSNSFPNLIHYYKLDNNVLDSVGGNSPINNSVNFTVGKQNNCGIFNPAAPSYFYNTPILSYNSFTISMWIKTNMTGTGYLFANSIFGGAAGVEMFITGGKLRTKLTNNAIAGTSQLTSAQQVNTNTWRHVAFTFDKSTGVLKNCVDGYAVITGTYTHGDFSYNNSSTIGIANVDLFAPFSGNIDGIAIFNKALTDSELLDVFNVQNAGNDLI